MCLIKIHRLPKLSIFSKTVYKCLIPVDYDCFVTPYTQSPIKMGETYKGKFVSKRNLISSIAKREIADGFIHSYISLRVAKYMRCYGEVIVECEIPPFTLYYEGDYDEIASKKLKYLKIVR